MSRPRTPIGSFGETTFAPTGNGLVRARVLYRDWDGKTRQIQASGQTRASAERLLKAKISDRDLLRPGVPVDVTADSSFADLVDYWLADIELEDRLARQTRDRYAYHMRQLVLPAFGSLSLREIGVARCDLFVKALAKKSYNKARQAKVVMRLAFGLAYRHEIIPKNPMDGIGRLHKPAHTPDALTPQEVNAIRIAVRFWETGIAASGPKPDGQLSAIIEVMLGTSARIGEALALRRRDVDVDGPRPSVSIGGTIVTPRGEPPYRQDHPKTAKSRRTVAIPSFTAEAIRFRLITAENASPDALVFCSRNGTPLTPNNVRRQLRHVLDLAGIEGVTPHMFRRTVATAINEHADVDLAAELLGHTDSKITVQHYIRRSEMFNPATADILERTFKPDWCRRCRQIGDTVYTVCDIVICTHTFHIYGNRGCECQLSGRCRVAWRAWSSGWSSTSPWWSPCPNSPGSRSMRARALRARTRRSWCTGSKSWAGWAACGPRACGSSSPAPGPGRTAPGTGSSSSAPNTPPTPAGPACWRWSQRPHCSAWPSTFPNTK